MVVNAGALQVGACPCLVLRAWFPSLGLLEHLFYPRLHIGDVCERQAKQDLLPSRPCPHPPLLSRAASFGAACISAPRCF